MKRVSLLLLLVTMLSACTIRFEYGITVNEDESGTIAFFIGADEEMRDFLDDPDGSEGFLTDVQEVPEGWTATEVSQDEFEGVVVASEFESFDDLRRRIDELEGGQDPDSGSGFVEDIELEKDGNRYQFRATVSATIAEDLSPGTDSMFTEDEVEQSLEDLFDLRFELALPGEIVDHNADEVDGNTVLWVLDPLADGGAELLAVSEVSSAVELLDSIESIDTLLSVDENDTGSLVLTLVTRSDEPVFDISGDLAGVDGWELVAQEATTGQIQVQTQFESLRDMERQIDTLEGTAFGALAGCLTGIETTHRDGEFRVAVDVGAPHPALAAALAGESATEMQLRLSMPGDVTSSNAIHEEGSIVAWDVVPKESGETFVAVADISGLPLVPILLALAALGALGGLLVVWRRRNLRSEYAAGSSMNQDAASENR